MRKMIDLHMHIIPDVDDGAESLKMSKQMLQMAIEQGVEVVFATSHSYAYRTDTKHTRHQYRKLKKLIQDEHLPIQLYEGCEVFCDIRCVDKILEGLESGRIPSLNGTRYVLIELFHGLGDCWMFYLYQLLEKNWIPVIAHAERVGDLSIDIIREMKAAGCLIQVNAYSVAEEKNEKTKARALELLEHKLVDFIGSDAHRMDHRPPAVAEGIEYLYANFEEAYVDDILYNNAKNLLLKSEEESKQGKSNPWFDGIMGVVVGDALGMPVQFLKRDEVQSGPIFTMDGFGTFDLPPGAWSDDSSLTLATLNSIVEQGKIDCDDIMERFVDWYDNGAYTPYGFSFDIGATCTEAICKYGNPYGYKDCGCSDEYSNGNGSLMRIMPACLFVYEQVKNGELTEEEGLKLIHDVSALTHAHLRSKIACGFYYFLVKAILDGEGDLISKLQKGVDAGVRFYNRDCANLVQMAYYGRLFHLDEFAKTPEDMIKSSGYVVDSLEAAVWSLITTDSLEEALLKAVNLGGDTDTIGAIAGGLAALHYGYENIPRDWKEAIVKGDKIMALCGLAEGEFRV